MTADRPEVSSSRSSRTRDKSLQISTPAVDRRPTCLTHFVIFDYSKDRTIASSYSKGRLTCSLYGCYELCNFPRNCPGANYAPSGFSDISQLFEVYYYTSPPCWLVLFIYFNRSNTQWGLDCTSTNSNRNKIFHIRTCTV